MNDKIDQIIVVLGLSKEGRPHAARFSTAEEELARRAAQAMGYQVLAVTTPEDLKLAGELPQGRAYKSGKSFAPLVARKVYDELAKLLPAAEKAAGPASDSAKDAPALESQREGEAAAAIDPSVDPASTAPAPPEPSLRAFWGKLQVGSEVLATAPGVDGWWEAEVVGVSEKGKMLTLRWTGYPDEPLFMAPRTKVGLPFPAQA